MSAQWTHDIHAAFQADPNLTARIIDAAHRHPTELSALFGDIAKYILNPAASSTLPTNAKKRKLDETPIPSQSANGTRPDAGITNPTTTFECKNVSFQVPARKKLKLQIVTERTNSRQQQVRLLNPQTDHAEYILSNSQIDQIFCLPVPEKQQRQSSFVIFPTTGAVNAEGMPYDQVVFTVNETKPDDATSSTREKADNDTYVTVTEPELNQLLQPYGKHVVRPSDTEFASAIPQPHRKGEKAYHVKAHRGSKEGYLFFLPNGIVFGFKKPLAFFPFSNIESISYTSVLQRTFNLVITSNEDDGTGAKEVEFSMIDQADFAGIDGYIKRHGLNDASMAAERRAKAYNVNKESKKGDANGEANGAAHTDDDDMTELQKAEQQLQDAEDEEEEDYEESGGDSDGSGEESDEDGEQYGEGDEYDEEEGDAE